ncbi:glycoside hydrolase family 2 protein [Lacticaseibacillus jixiensis]|uniref:glycoside hydrolase family 2 protein n=1 Tax=Lacticaseibacillus jixiensis TaxID=3231926 RepID=UPI0036F1B476
MRQQLAFNDGWGFTKAQIDPAQPAENLTPVTLPHTWNAQDGQDGGNDYYRGTCWYQKRFADPTHQGQSAWLEIQGAAMSATVYLNGRKLATHHGGYATFRVALTDLAKENLLSIAVDNSVNDTVYPQRADFTFYGGLYRPVALVLVEPAHFALDHAGDSGITISTRVAAQAGIIDLDASVAGAAQTVDFIVGDQQCSAAVVAGHAQATMTIESVHLWNGKADPFLYPVTARLHDRSGVVDEVQLHCGFRTMTFDPQHGFFLNHHAYRLCGVARHQDRAGVGNAVSAAMEDEDFELIRELGATTVRLAHYQQSQHVYDLCDRYGLVVWAEVPVISERLAHGDENAMSQLRELICQNRHHPSIACWSLSNEITVGSEDGSELLAFHQQLNDLAHQLDATRPTTMANLFMLDGDSPLVTVPDIRSYNLYYGWYVGELEQNEAWLDAFHQAHPQLVIGLSEYGADALVTLHAAKPAKGDFSEEYQAVYHEHMLAMWAKRPYLWAMHAWNMFDFAADGRADSGEPGINHKGLVTFDRKLKKDAFYLYKAYLSPEPFVHLCGRRYADRAETTTEIKVYSNQPQVTLIVDGKQFAQETGDKVFTFKVPITGVHQLKAVAGQFSDEIKIRHVTQPNASYRLPQATVTNWFDTIQVTAPDGYYSLNDRIVDLQKNPTAAKLVAAINQQLVQAFGDVAKNVKIPAAMQAQLAQLTLKQTLQQATGKLSDHMLQAIAQKANEQLNQIPKP